MLKDNNATNQLALLTLVVNTAVIGNYTQPNHNAVPGILSPNATFNGSSVNLAQYFNGALKSTNDNNTAVSVSFLDGGGAAPLTMSLPANDTSSKQLCVSPEPAEYPLTPAPKLANFSLTCTATSVLP